MNEFRTETRAQAARVFEPTSPAGTLVLSVVLAVAYVFFGRLTFALSVEYGNVTSVVFIPEGIALAFCIRFGSRVAGGIFIGQTILSLWSGPSLLGGAVITEEVFAYPGVGRLAIQAIANRDFTVVQAFVLLMAALIVMINLLVDLSYGFLDPRLRKRK